MRTPDAEPIDAADFEALLELAIAGRIQSDTGTSEAVDAALAEIAARGATPARVNAARAAFARST